MQEKKFGLIGRTLKHSYSKIIHNHLGDYPYDLYEMESDALESFVKGKSVSGYNVTIPYKTEIIPYLDKVEGVAEEIGAINTVVNKDGKLIGYNTDFDGMAFMLKKGGISLKDKTVLVLGSGGTSKTANVVCRHLGAKEVFTVSRTGKVNYQNCYDINAEVIINTTPVGMFPNNYEKPIDLKRFSRLEGVADVVYNPSLTALTNEAKELGIKHVNGLYMLVAQAKFAAEKFLDKKIDDSVIDDIFNKLVAGKQNIVLIGMPGSGKSTVGKIIAERLGLEFIDTDYEIVKREGRDIPTIFKDDGEEYFRKVEAEVLKDVGKLTGKVIATGGGIVKNIANRYPLRSNGKIFYLKRSVEKLVTDGRPLSKDLETVKKLYAERKEMYEAFADQTVDNDGEIEKTIKGVLENL
ncbi:MAG: shikimate dehydrogenase [Clostridia bacterium]|nr:shikimate dehydrogenase [Clostridia bacterium]